MQFERCQELLQQYRDGLISAKENNSELWRARQTVESAYHPDTNEKACFWFNCAVELEGDSGCMFVDDRFSRYFDSRHSH